MGKIILLKPNGSLKVSTSKLLEVAGEPVEIIGRNPFAKIVSNNSVLDKVPIIRPEDMADKIAQFGKEEIICALMGLDWVHDSDHDELEIISILPFAKRTKQSAKVCIFGRTNKFVDGPNIRVASLYHHLGQGKNGFQQAQIDILLGAIEANVLAFDYDFGIDVVETGKSIEAAGLVIVREILTAPTVLVAHKEALGMEEIKAFGKRLEEAIPALQIGD